MVSHMTHTETTTTAEQLAKIAAKIDEAARELNPLLLDKTAAAGAAMTRASVAARRAHDALNALAAARLEVGLLQLDDTEESKS